MRNRPHVKWATVAVLVSTVLVCGGRVASSQEEPPPVLTCYNDLGHEDPNGLNCVIPPFYTVRPDGSDVTTTTYVPGPADLNDLPIPPVLVEPQFTG